MIGLALALPCATQVRARDFWWHAATGRHIVDQGAVPQTDPFSFLAGGEPWKYVNWLADLVLYGAFDLGGGAGVVALKLALVGVALSGVAWAARGLGATAGATASVLALIAWLVQPRYSLERPMLIGAALLGLSVALGVRWWNRRDRSLWLLVIATAVWLPSHGSALLGPLWAWGIAGALVLTPKHLKADGGTAFGVALACSGLMLAMPEGRDVIATVRGLDDASWVTSLTQDWQATAWSVDSARVSLLVVCLGILGSLVGAGGRVANPRPLMLAACALGVAIGARYVRSLNEALLLAGAPAAVGITQAQRWLQGRNYKTLAGITPFALVASLALAHGHWAGDQSTDGQWGFGVDPRPLPDDVLPTLSQLPEGRVLNNLELGGYLIWQETPVFIDGRTVALYSEEMFTANVVPTLESPEGLEAVADAWDIRYGLVSQSSAPYRNMSVSPLWVPVLHGQSASLFVRAAHLQSVLDAGVDPQQDVRWVDDPGFLEVFYGVVLADEARTQALYEDLEKATQRLPAPAVIGRVWRYVEGRR